MNDFVKGNPLLCIGCRTCMIACVVAHSKVDIFSTNERCTYFKPRIKVKKTKAITMTVQCHQCENAPCVTACPTGALKQGLHSVEFAAASCIGCHQCSLACPFGAIEMIDEQATTRVIANKCDLCAQTKEGQPACVAACPTGALVFYTQAVQVEAASMKNQAAAVRICAVGGKQIE